MMQNGLKRHLEHCSKKPHLCREHAATPEDSGLCCRRIGGGRPWLGYELYVPDAFDRWVYAKMDVLVRDAGKQRPLAPDIGGASGFKAMGVAACGLNVMNIDCVGQKDIIAKRNRRLAANSGCCRRKRRAGRIRLAEMKVQDIDFDKMKDLCGGKKPVLVMASRVIHFMTFQDIRWLFKLVSHTAEKGAVFALQYDNNVANKTGLLFWHDPEKVSKLAERYGFCLEYESIVEGSRSIQGFRLERPHGAACCEPK
ncbi:MAG: hypothetical protein PHE27_08165, partial [Alphaproteobacteria bacterium]|nr:hypothetical protein [Alphaproteobacteria bacterium]